MAVKKRLWLWNLILVLTVFICSSALILHFKNWITVKPNEVRVMSGFYNVTIPYNRIDSLVFVERIPPMERLNGFSALEKEKGIFREFKDSLTDKKVHVFADNISQQKIKIVYYDSLKLYLNLKDSVKTFNLFQELRTQTNQNSVPN